MIRFIVATLMFFCEPILTAPAHPHIIFIFADDLGWNDVPWHNSFVNAPNMKSLALNGIILNQSYVQPICTPSRSAFLTGKYPFTLGRQHGSLGSLQPTGLTLTPTLLPQSLKTQGYSTNLVGKWHLGFCSANYTPTYRGFDTFFGYYNGAQDYYTHTLSTGSSERTDDGIEKSRASDPYDFRLNTDVYYDPTNQYSTYLYATYVEDLLSSRNSDDPLFLHMAFQSVHSPVEVPSNYTSEYTSCNDTNRQTYLGMVTAMDEAIGRIVASLKSTGHYDNSVIIFSTDNGGQTMNSASNYPLRGVKDTLWEGGIRGPAFVNSPLLTNIGTTYNNLFHVTDWYPTIMTIAGGSTPSGIDGTDQWAALKGSTTTTPRSTIVHNIDEVDEKAAIRVGDYKLLVSPGQGTWTLPPEGTSYSTGRSIPKELANAPTRIGDVSERRSSRLTTTTISKRTSWLTSANSFLFDVTHDPNETTNLSKKKPSIVASLLADLETAILKLVATDDPANVAAGNPSNFKNIWSSGWC